ncbi:MAG: hypothetical protein E7453_09355 [Ruminococcaceae bacterium]|nr:hypothetical protein [Oscillospiraceae bacterium]
MNFKKLLIIILVLGITLLAFSGCTAALLVLGASYFLGEPTEPTEPTVPDITDPQTTDSHPAFKSRVFLYRS